MLWTYIFLSKCSRFEIVRIDNISDQNHFLMQIIKSNKGLVPMRITVANESHATILVLSENSNLIAEVDLKNQQAAHTRCIPDI